MELPKSHFVKFTAPDETPQNLDRGDMQELVRLLTKYAPHDEAFALTKEGIQVIRSSKVQKDRAHCFAVPSMCLVPQGKKSVTFGNSGFEYGGSRMVVYSAAIPINVKITEASAKEPYFCLVIPLDPLRLRELSSKVFPQGVPKVEKTHAVYVGETTPYLLKSATRVMTLIEQQENADLLVPLAIDEVLIRLLRSPVGPALAQIGILDSHAEKVSKAITWLKHNFHQSVRMEELAKIAGMSISAFYTHFKMITDMSPLQYQKVLRLQEARLLIQTQMMDVGQAAQAVGYVSPTQFSREYSREFGISPSKDMHYLKAYSK